MCSVVVLFFPGFPFSIVSDSFLLSLSTMNFIYFNVKCNESPSSVYIRRSQCKKNILDEKWRKLIQVVSIFIGSGLRVFGPCHFFFISSSSDAIQFTECDSFLVGFCCELSLNATRYKEHRNDPACETNTDGQNNVFNFIQNS